MGAPAQLEEFKYHGVFVTSDSENDLEIYLELGSFGTMNWALFKKAELQSNALSITLPVTNFR